jgi:hypothetical protein
MSYKPLCITCGERPARPAGFYCLECQLESVRKIRERAEQVVNEILEADMALVDGVTAGLYCQIADDLSAQATRLRQQADALMIQSDSFRVIARKVREAEQLDLQRREYPACGTPGEDGR